MTMKWVSPEDAVSQFKLVEFCTKHPKYKALRKPTADCEQCRKLWRISKGVYR